MCNRKWGLYFHSRNLINCTTIKFKRRFTEIVKRSEFKDHEYTGWLTETIGYAEKKDLPIFYDAESINSGPIIY